MEIFTEKERFSLKNEACVYECTMTNLFIKSLAEPWELLNDYAQVLIRRSTEQNTVGLQKSLLPAPEDGTSFVQQSLDAPHQAMKTLH